MKPGLYFHIPFCKNKCNYCDFYFTTSSKEKDAFTDALLKEIEIFSQSRKFPYEIFDTVYFGGGTPSFLGARRIKKILKQIKTYLPYEPSSELTIEINPDSGDRKFLESMKAAEVNRISLGVQAFHDKTLLWMNRGHTVQDIHEAIKNIKELGFENFSLDLMHSIPRETLSDFEFSLNEAIQANPNHLSLYSLTVELGTPLDKAVQNKKEKRVSDDKSAEIMRFAQSVLKDASFIHYELSNFAKNGASFAKHNLKYWHFEPYFGFGPSAHSFDGRRRWSNVRSLKNYIADLQKGVLPIRDEEEFDLERRFVEKVMLSLRIKEGISFEDFERDFGFDFEFEHRELLESLTERNLVDRDPFGFCLTDEGFLLYNAIVLAFLDRENSNIFSGKGGLTTTLT